MKYTVIVMTLAALAAFLLGALLAIVLIDGTMS